MASAITTHYGNFIKINGVSIKDPSSYKASVYDLDSSSATRTADGTLIRDRIAVKRKIEMSWSALTQLELTELLTAVEDEWFTCSFYEPVAGGFVEKTMYVGDRTAPMALLRSNGEYVWEGLSMNFIEQ